MHAADSTTPSVPVNAHVDLVTELARVRRDTEREDKRRDGAIAAMMTVWHAQKTRMIGKLAAVAVSTAGEVFTVVSK
ncbi:hypothetical protein FMUAM8_55950 [Nocardia cyriacigeorgica]|nr:hypothetical protein FMUAM8_55950 [Nocardia cyriacigeorgica]